MKAGPPSLEIHEEDLAVVAASDGEHAVRRAEIVMRVVIERLPKLRRRGRTTQHSLSELGKYCDIASSTPVLVYGTSLRSGPGFGMGGS